MVYNHEKACTDILNVLAAWDIPIKNVVCLMGDNVEFNKSLCKALDLPQGKCLAHALALIVKSGYDHIPNLHNLLINSTGVLTAGGTNKRIKVLKEEYNLVPNHMQAYTNRFGSMVKAADYHYDNFESIHNFFTVRLGKNDLRIQSLDDVENVENEGYRSNKDKVFAAFSDKFALLSIKLCKDLWKNIPEAIELASSDFFKDFGTYDTLLNYLSRWGIYFPTLNNLPRIEAFITNSLREIDADYVKDEHLVKEAVDKFSLSLQLAAKQSSKLLEKHVKPTSICYELKRRFDVRSRPLKISLKPTEHEMRRLNAEFFFGDEHTMNYYSPNRLKKDGTMDRQLSDQDLFTDYILYSRYWYENEQDMLKETTGFDFWVWDKTKRAYPNLSLLATWWGIWPTSSVAAERALATGRIIDMPSRRSMSWENFSIEAKLRINNIIVDKLLQQRLDKSILQCRLSGSNINL
jgi:hypothetical protein